MGRNMKRNGKELKSIRAGIGAYGLAPVSRVPADSIIFVDSGVVEGNAYPRG
jgi:hypothetical protein